MKPFLITSVPSSRLCAFCPTPAAFTWSAGVLSLTVCPSDQARLARWSVLRLAALGPTGTAQEAAEAFPQLLELSAQLWDDLVAAATS